MFLVLKDGGSKLFRKVGEFYCIKWHISSDNESPILIRRINAIFRCLCYQELLLGAFGSRRERYLAVVVWTFRRSSVPDCTTYSYNFIHFLLWNPTLISVTSKKSFPTSQRTYFASTREINYIMLHLCRAMCSLHESHERNKKRGKM
jgi:hypothetical protein